MKNKFHFYVSYLKSLVRIIVCICAAAYQSMYILGIGLALAEIFGIMEEFVDLK